MKFKNDIEAQAGFKDAGGDLGVAGQLLSSTGTQTNWVDASTVIGGPYLPLTAGSTVPLSGDLYLNNATYIRSTDSNGAVPRIFGINPSNSTYIGPIDAYAGGSIFYGVSANVSAQTFYTGASARMHINSTGNVGIGTTSPGAKLQIDSVPDNVAAILANQVYARISLGQQGGSGDAHFGASGNGAPEVGFQDYGFYASHNAYRSSTGAWKHSRTSVVPAARFLGSGAAATGNQGFSFDYSANVGTADITWTNLMKILPSGNVGIGTSTPIQKLEVNGNAIIGGGTLDNPQGWGKILQVQNTSSNGAGISVKDSNNEWNLATYNGVFNISDGIEERIIINSSGNVGIGTPSPAQKLDVVGKMKISDDIILAQTNGRIDYDNGVSSGALRFFSTSGNSERMRITSAGGISFGSTGTAYGTSGQILKSNANASPTWVDASTVIGGPYLPLTAGLSYPLTGTLYLGNVASDQKIQFQRTGGNVYSIEHDSAQLYFYNRTTTESPLVIQNDGDVLMNAGNVGIGTTSPGTKLHIVVPGGSSQLTLERTGGGAGKVVLAGAAEGLIVYDDVYGPKMYVGTSGTYNGNVGIGTTSPSYKLDVSGDGIRNIRATAGWAGWFENTGSSSGVVVTAGVDSGDAPLLIRKQDGTELFSVRGNGVSWFNNGNVGIGTTSPTNKLDIRQSTSGGSDVLGTGAITIGSDNPYWTLRGTATSLQDLAFDRSYAGTWYESMRIQRSTGNVGIGTTSPNHKLDIYSNENVPLRIHRPSNANLDSSGAWGIGFSTRGDANTSTTDTRAGIFSYYNGNLFLAAANTSIVADPDAYARLTILNAGSIKFNSYNSTNNTGTPTYLLGTDASGNIVKTNTVPGSAAGPYLPLAGGTMTGT
jgi:hypothetical protein